MTEPPAVPIGEAELYRFLETHGIAYRRFEHPAVFTCEEAERLVPREAEGVHTKNLFLRDKKGRRHCLLVTTCEKPVDLRSLARQVGADNLSLASAERLARFLGVTAGAVTVLGLVNDRASEVDLLMDAEVWRARAIRSHPLVNTATLVLEQPAVERFLGVTGHTPRLIEVPVRQPGP